MLRPFAFAAAMFVLIAPAAADDVFTSTPSSNWTGVYIGANGGYAWAGDYDSNITVFNPAGVPYASGPLPYTIDLDGGFGGGQAGYNHQLGLVVVGVEADIQLSEIDGSSSTAYAPPVIFPFTYNASTEIDWFGTVRGRIGLINGDSLVYVTGGYAYGEVAYTARYLIPQNNAYANLHKSDTQDGYVLGAGVEHKVDSNWSLKFEYQYLNLGEEEVSGGLFFANGNPSNETVTSSYEAELHTLRVGLNYRFGQ
jgi:outer membrane immunogenic protein